MLAVIQSIQQFGIHDLLIVTYKYSDGGAIQVHHKYWHNGVPRSDGLIWMFLSFLTSKWSDTHLEQQNECKEKKEPWQCDWDNVMCAQFLVCTALDSGLWLVCWRLIVYNVRHHSFFICLCLMLLFIIQQHLIVTFS